MKGQRQVAFDVPREVLSLSRPHLQAFLSHVTVTWPAEIEVPELRIVRSDHWRDGS
jgi:hypothetical protein